MSPDNAFNGFHQAEVGPLPCEYVVHLTTELAGSQMPNVPGGQFDYPYLLLMQLTFQYWS